MLNMRCNPIVLTIAMVVAGGILEFTESFTAKSTPLIRPIPNSAKVSSPRTSMPLYMGRSLEPLAKEGPWTAYLDDETTGLVYYFNSETGESSWDPPTATFPPIKMSKRLEEKMLAKRQSYNTKLVGFEEATQMRSTANEGNNNSSESNSNQRKGIFGNLFSPKAKVEPIVVEEPPMVPEKEDEPEEGIILSKTSSFFGTFFGSKSVVQLEQTEEEFYDQMLYEDAVPVVEEEVVYDQENVEDAIPVVTEESQVGKAKKTFVDDIMSFASFPATKKEEKIVEIVSKPLTFQIASKILPHPAKVSWGGEDALFVSGRSFGVFDGVSGAEKVDGVPLYSTTLAKRLKSEIGKESLTIDEMRTKLLSAAEFADVSATGASTAVIASIGEDDVMRSLCLGDSVIMVIRNGAVLAKTKETTHYFDCPYQLSEDSPDRPKDGTTLTTKLAPGDIIVAGSDGVFDNLEDSEIVRLTSDNTIKLKPTLLAQKIVAESRKVSLDPMAPTPYAKQAKRNRYQNYVSGLGGKVDDISCIVVSVTSD